MADKIPFVRRRSLTWTLGTLAALLVFAREPLPLNMPGVVGFIGYSLGAAGLASIFQLIAKHAFRAGIQGDAHCLYWNTGIAAYIAFFLFTWQVLGA